MTALSLWLWAGLLLASSPAERIAVEASSGLGRSRQILSHGASEVLVPSHRVYGWEQRARRLPDGRYDVTVITRTDVPRPPAAHPRVPPSNDPMSRWLGGSEAACSSIRELAAELVAGQTDQVGASTAIIQWVSLNVRHEDEPPHDDGAAVTLESRVGSCVGRSRLAVALLRAAGLPARTVHGLVVTPSPPGQPAAFKLHRFIETFIDGAGWIPSDPGDSIHLVAPTHLILALDDEPYDPEWQRDLQVTAMEQLADFKVTDAPEGRPLVLRSWGSARRAGTIPR